MGNEFKRIKKLVADIKNLKIQGASKIREASVLALANFVRNVKAKDENELRSKLKKAAGMIAFNTRPTEPETRNAIRKIIIASYEELPLDELREHIARVCIGIEVRHRANLSRIAEIASEFLKGCNIIFTHCHSNTVELVLKRMHEKGYLHAVINTETRPLFQGRITSKNLAKSGIPCTHIVDSASAAFIKHADAFVTGCDVILAEGSIINKIGTFLISLAAKKFDIPHYVITSSSSFDPETEFGIKEKIEERSPKEIWEKPPKGVSIRNPAFDITPAEQVSAIITEHGVQTPNEFVKDMERRLKLNEKPFITLAELLE